MKQIVAAIVLFCSAASGQEFRASISGDITDSSNAPAPRVRVVAVNRATNVSNEALTNDAGYFMINFLAPGNYNVIVEHTGFKKFVRENIVLGVSDRFVLDVSLQVGSLTESVTVTGSTSLLQTETATRVSFIEKNMIDRVPSNGRNAFLLTHSLPGVEKGGYWGSAELYAYGQVSGVSISGGRMGENESVIDGVTDSRPSRGVNFIPALDSLSEVSVQTNVYDAQFARTGGGVNVFGTKSGTNSLHGALYEHLKHEKFIAPSWGYNKAVGELLGANPNAPYPSRKFRNNTYGFEVDGPVFIPKLFDGRNRMFFLLSYEGEREGQSSIQTRTLPSSEQLNGDFSNLKAGNGSPVTIHDPLTTDPTTGLRSVFPGNRIPANRISPVAKAVAAYYPKPTGAGETAAGLNNYIAITPERNAYTQWTGKLDYRIDNKNNVFFRRGELPYENYKGIVWGYNEAEPSGENPSTRRAISYGADWTSTLSPTLVWNLRGGLSRTENTGGNTLGVGFDPKKLGFNPALTGQFDFLQYPRFNLGQYSELGTSPASLDISDSYSIQPNITLVRGTHVLKIGSEFRLYNQNNYGPGYASGIYNVSRAWTQRDAQRGDALSGNEFAAFLLGYPNSGAVDKNINPAVSWRYYSAYVQDDWKVTQKLTLNLGLRWDYEAPAAERFNRQIRGFAFNQPSPIANQVAGLTLRGGLLYAGTSGNDRQAFQRDFNNWQPRFGVAYRMKEKLVLRGGWGLVYLGQNAVGPSTGYSRTTAIIASADGGLTPRVDLANPFPEGLLKPIGNSQGLATNLGLAAGFQFLNRPLPYAHQYSAGFQYQLPWGIRADVSYVGNQTGGLPIGAEYNFLPISELNKPVSYYTDRVANPMAGLMPNNSAKNGATIPRQDLLLPYPQYTSVSASNVPIGKQRHDAMQSSFVRRFGSGFSMAVNFTISKTLEQTNFLNAQDFNPADPEKSKLEKRLVDFDATRHFGVLASYEFPFGKGRRFANSMPYAVNLFVTGWTLSGNYNRRSGLPLDFPNAAPLAARSAKLSDAQRDELATQYGQKQWDVSYVPFFDTTLFPKTAGPAPFTLRDFPTRFPDVRGFGLNNLDFTISKQFPIKERVKFEYRADLLNSFNTHYFRRLDSNGNNVTSARFGFIRQDPTLDPRIIVMVLRLTF